MQNFPYMCISFPIPAYGNPQVYGKFPSANKKSLYLYGTFKSTKESSYFHMGYLRLFFKLYIYIIL